jgi:hypothetical protein
MAITYDPFGTPFDDGVEATAYDVPQNNTALPGGLLDVGSEVFDFAKASLGKLLDVYAYREVAETNAMYSPPPGYQRVPGSTQVVPAGTVFSGAGGLTVSPMMLAVVAVAAVVWFAAKKV